MTRRPTKGDQDGGPALVDFTDDHNQKILDAIVAHEH
jgi:hypothetical protein